MKTCYLSSCYSGQLLEHNWLPWLSSWWLTNAAGMLYWQQNYILLGLNILPPKVSIIRQRTMRFNEFHFSRRFSGHFCFCFTWVSAITVASICLIGAEMCIREYFCAIDSWRWYSRFYWWKWQVVLYINHL